MTNDGLFTWDDMDRVVDSFPGVDPEDAFTAINAAVLSPRLGDGTPIDPGAFDPAELSRSLIDKYVSSRALVEALAVEQMFADEDAIDNASVASAMQVVAGVEPDEYALAKDERDAGYPSRLCDIHAKYIERS